jgi:hypothetical protein
LDSLTSQIDIAWAAGLFEGEGCITKLNRGTTIQLSITSTDYDVLEKFKGIVGCGTIYLNGTPRKDTHKQAYRWALSASRDVKVILGLIRPHLCLRRAEKADEALLILSRNGSWGLGELFDISEYGNLVKVIETNP